MGRGSSGSGAAKQNNTAYGGHGTLANLISAMQQANSSRTGSGNEGFHDGEGVNVGDYDNYGNPATVKWQQQTDDAKTSRYLAKLGKQQTPAADAEGYTYHQSSFQNMVIDQNLNAPVYAKLSKSEFAQYCRQNGLTPIYRGWSGQASMDRFENAAASHTGAGMYGEGYYFGDKSTASSYGSTMSVAALSPAARVVDLSTVQAAIRRSGASSAFSRSGQTASSGYGNNIGEAQMAIKMGYNVIRTGWSYVVLTRDAVVIQK